MKVQGPLLAALCMLAHFEVAIADETAGETLPRNRLEFTTVYFDAFNTDEFTGLFSYTRNLSAKVNLTAQLSYLDARVGNTGGSGPGDSTLTVSYLPDAELAFGPWLPRIVGSGISVTLPTGDEEEGRGLGSTVVTPFLGTVLPLGERWSFTPTLAYAWSLDPIVTGTDVSVALLDLGFTWVGESGVWVSVVGGYIKDFEADKTSTSARVSAGFVFESGWGLTASFIDIDSFQPGVPPPSQLQFDQVYELAVNYSF